MWGFVSVNQLLERRCVCKEGRSVRAHDAGDAKGLFEPEGVGQETEQPRIPGPVTDSVAQCKVPLPSNPRGSSAGFLTVGRPEGC